MFDIGFDRIVSIGESCGCAMMLRESRLRTASGPFDWLTGPSFEQRIDTLCSRFQDFLHEENLDWCEESRDNCYHDVYRDRTTGYRFVHDFPKEVSLGVGFQGVREKYERRFNRLLKAFDDGESICLVWRNLKAELLADESCRQALERLQATFVAAKIRLLVIENDPQMKAGELDIRTCAGGSCERVKGCFFREGYDILTGDVDLHMRVLRKLRRNPALARKCRRESMIRAVVRFISLWHMNRESRKRSREYWTRRLNSRGSV